LTADDGVNPPVVDSFDIDVAPDVPPTVSAPGDQSLTAGETLSAVATYTDDGSLPGLVTVGGAPPWAVVNDGGAGSISFGGTAAVGSWTVTLTADDGVNPPVVDSFDIDVT
jgi:hypothetical protein